MVRSLIWLKAFIMMLLLAMKMFLIALLSFDTFLFESLILLNTCLLRIFTIVLFTVLDRVLSLFIKVFILVTAEDVYLFTRRSQNVARE